jgi:SSS family transporter
MGNLTLFWLAAVGLAMVGTGFGVRRVPGLEPFLVARREVGIWTGAMSAAATWIWAPALFIAAQKAYQQGLAGLFWFTAPNVGALILFAFLARRVRAVFPRGYTLPEYVAQRLDPRCHLAYLFTFLSLQICSLAVQLIAGAALLETIGGLNYPLGVLILTAGFTSYSLLDGLRASIRTDLLQMGIILAGMAILIPMATNAAGGWETVRAGFAGAGGRFPHLWDGRVAYSFGITVTIGLLSGPVGDQQHWQRAFAFREGAVFRGYLLAAPMFALVPLGMSIPGFVAAGLPDAAPGVHAGLLSAQQVGPEVIRTLLPSWGMAIFLLMILSGLASTGDSALCAAGSLAAVDGYRRYLRPQADGGALLRVSRVAILAAALLATGIALIPGITILALFLFYGTLRSATFPTTLLLLYRKSLSPDAVFWGVVLAILLGMPTYLAGELLGIVHLKVAANLGILLVAGGLPLLWLPGKEKSSGAGR